MTADTCECQFFPAPSAFANMYPIRDLSGASATVKASGHMDW